MQLESFTSLLQDSLESTEKYFRNLTDSYSILGVVQEISEYSSKVKQEISEQYNKLSTELQSQCITAYDDFMNRCNKLIDKSMEAIRNNELINSLTGDCCFNDDSLNQPNK
jgi:hypothetical protein